MFLQKTKCSATARLLSHGNPPSMMVVKNISYNFPLTIADDLYLLHSVENLLNMLEISVLLVYQTAT